MKRRTHSHLSSTDSSSITGYSNRKASITGKNLREQWKVETYLQSLEELREYDDDEVLMHAGRLRPMAESESIVLEGNMNFWRGRLAGILEGGVCLF